jgi:hypothetical protein
VNPNSVASFSDNPSPNQGHMKKTLMLLLLISITAIHTQAQTQSAAIARKGHIILPAETALQEVYEFDISPLNFENELDAVAYFRDRADQFYFYRPVLAEQKALLYLQLEAQPDWTINDWNVHLKKRTVISGTENLTKTSTKTAN